jgi:hypothetical protein
LRRRQLTPFSLTAVDAKCGELRRRKARQGFTGGVFSDAKRDVTCERELGVDIHVKIVLARRQRAPGVDPGEIGAVGALAVEKRRIKLQLAFGSHGLPNHQGDRRGAQDFNFHVVTPYCFYYWDNDVRVTGVQAP